MAALLARVRTLVLALALLAAVPVAARSAALPTRAILNPWPDRQTAEGAFRDWPGEKIGGGGGYGESVLGFALLTEGLRTGDERLRASGERALRWALVHPARVLAGRQSVFEDLSLATAADTLRGRLPPDVEAALRLRLGQTVIARLPGLRYSNHALAEALRVITTAHAGIQVRDLDGLAAAQLVNTQAPRFAHAAAVRGRPATTAVFSDPPVNPIGYHGLTLAFLARAAELLGPSASPALRLTVVRMAEGSAALIAPDGDLAYWGRSQEESWALAYTAYGAQVAARLRPAVAPRMRALARRALARLQTRHLGPDGLRLTPAAAPRADGGDPRAGLDGYASLPAYTGLTAMGLQWLGPGWPDGPTAAIGPDHNGATVLSQGESRFATVRAGRRWWAVKQTPSRAPSSDWRADFGLVAFKTQGLDGHWVDTLPLRPYDFRTACGRFCRRPPPSAGPVLLTRRGPARPVGTRLRVSGGSVVSITGSFRRRGRRAGRLVARFRPDPAGVRLGWSTGRHRAYRMTGLFDQAGGPVCARDGWVGNARGSLRLPNLRRLKVLPGRASASQQPVVLARVTMTAGRRHRLWAVWSAAPVRCG